MPTAAISRVCIADLLPAAICSNQATSDEVSPEVCCKRKTLQRWPPAAISKRQNAHPVQPESRCPTNHRTLLTGIEGDLRKSGEPENARRRWRYVDNATTHERTTIVDGDNH